MESPQPFDPNEPAKVAQWATQANELKEENTDPDIDDIIAQWATQANELKEEDTDPDIDDIIAQWATQANELKEENTDPDIDDIIDLFIEPRGKPPGAKVEVTRNLVIYLCKKARDIFFAQPILLELMAPLKVCGDIYGQHYQLLRMFENNGFPPEANYLFLGNYVGKGRQSIETICTLLAYKIKYPENFFLLRGNQESLLVSSVASFYQECGSRYGLEVADLFEDCFNCMPVASIIGDKIFAVHGGLSPQLDSFEQIRRIRRPAMVPRDGLLHDLLWAYPEAAMRGWSGRHSEFSLAFGPNVVESFLEKHGLDLVCRSGQFIQEGYEFFAGRKLVTLFTTPNYLGKHDNSGAVMCVDEDLLYTFQVSPFPFPRDFASLWLRRM
ncbi:Metallo-dependent phosphatase-like protein [Dactylonectria macrodidyma]|uniref:protein-serine/threonine phosphatase n=1 Tax=Dactylonectria macrodidyma TaxID=307937 RepID=A0A9P9FGM8_9HYPO|nr:Metallo-dependent phosphatase-like protein [Dactylonectria macrodidyma]